MMMLKNDIFLFENVSSTLIKRCFSFFGLNFRAHIRHAAARKSILITLQTIDRLDQEGQEARCSQKGQGFWQIEASDQRQGETVRACCFWSRFFLSIRHERILQLVYIVAYCFDSSHSNT
jgi:hypothetical protein